MPGRRVRWHGVDGEGEPMTMSGKVAVVMDAGYVNGSMVHMDGGWIVR